MYLSCLKRVMDIVIALILVVFLSPLLIAIGLILFVQNGGDVFFCQLRPGYKEKPFYMIKFKTMTDAKDNEGNLLPDVDRITFIGALLRKLSLDELPQLLNVLKGNMSLVGPRPLLFKYLPLYSDEQRRRHDVKPGITGWAQVNGRNTISWQKKFELDLFYIQNVSFILDMKIIWLTILKILKREGINQSKARPMQPFDGSN